MIAACKAFRMSAAVCSRMVVRASVWMRTVSRKTSLTMQARNYLTAAVAQANTSWVMQDYDVEVGEVAEVVLECQHETGYRKQVTERGHECADDLLVDESFCLRDLLLRNLLRQLYRRG